VSAKLYAFALGSAIAALGGILIGFRFSTIVFTNFDPFQSIYAIAFAVIGGLGYVAGPLFGSGFASGGIGSLLNPLLTGIDKYLVLIGGVFVIGTLVLHPDGIVRGMLDQIRRIAGRRRIAGPQPETLHALRRLGRRSSPTGGSLDAEAPTAAPERVRPETLEVLGLTVRFGRTVAVDDVTLRVEPGEIVGLIGPNGAGKSTLIDAVTGFVPIVAGTIRLGDHDMRRTPTHRRVRAGVARSWQSLELFEHSSVLENIQIASEAAVRDWAQAALALVRPRTPVLSAPARAAIREFELSSDLDRVPADLSYARRRLVGIARTVALNPSVLLLDEPAAGLGEAESRELGVMLRNLANTWGVGILLVEHDVELVMSLCSRIVVLDFGRKIAEGTPAEVRRDTAVIGAYLGTSEDAEDKQPSPEHPTTAA
jgi:sulfate-transporting ATPase